MNIRRRVVQVGLGARSNMYWSALVGKYANDWELVALCDSNPGRVAHVRIRIGRDAAPAGYAAEEFDRMIAEMRPDTVIVTTMDSAHDEYICRAMEAGCDVITEKPMTIDAARCRRILETQKRTGRSCRVTFNYRYSPPRLQVKHLLMDGVIGDIRSVDFNWMLDTSHGADYFRRWHRHKENGGGLLVHKATHHFDLMNWWLSAVPEKVTAFGQKRFATPEMARRLGLRNPGPRCHGCAEAETCPFFIDLTWQGWREMYFDNEQYDGYQRDRCVFGQEIDIEDAMQVMITYDNGAALSYSLTSFCAWEGYTIAFNGSKGRLEHKCQESVYMSGDGTAQGALMPEGTSIRIYPTRGTPYEVELWKGEGGHGGGDDRLLEDLFGPSQKDPYFRAADQRAGALSILCGIAGNLSIAEQRTVHIQELVSDVERPNYTGMPGPEPFALPR